MAYEDTKDTFDIVDFKYLIAPSIGFQIVNGICLLWDVTEI